MINFIKGAKIQDCTELEEGYKIAAHSIEAVVNAEKIAVIFKSFAEKFSLQTFFLFIEVPCDLTDENTYHSQEDHDLHKDVYYLDNISSNTVTELFDLFGDILINDGMVCCGIGTNGAEIGKYKYNMIVGYSEEISNLQSIFEENEIAENDGLRLPWDFISKNNPGESIRYEDDRKRTVYDIINTLTEVGLYKHETRSE